MTKVSSVPSHSIHGSVPAATRGGDALGAQGRIQGAPARLVSPPARVAEKAIEGNAQRKRDPSRLLEHWRGIAEQPVRPMARAEVLQRARTTGIRPGRLARQAITALRKGKGSGKAGYAALHFALSLLDEDIDDDERVALLTPVGEEFSDAEHLAERLWEINDPEELAQLLKEALPEGKLGDPKALLEKIKGLGRDRSALMDLLAEMQGIPRHFKDKEEREVLRADIENELHELESGADTRDVAFFKLAHLAEKQPNPLEFLETSLNVAKKEPSTWIELLRSILRGNPSGATSSDTFRGTVHHLILTLGVEMGAIRRNEDDRLRVINAQLQRVYTVHSLLDYLSELCGQVDRSIELQAIT
ncbi:hypothetical protein H4CHR_01948 [Variovorax sp. PBS-H4]|nr:hypothetical protein H4CHR_01948 [Variovorax sp. PBS-H4]